VVLTRPPVAVKGAVATRLRHFQVVKNAAGMAAEITADESASSDTHTRHTPHARKMLPRLSSSIVRKVAVQPRHTVCG
jgi:hypothetical protein